MKVGVVAARSTAEGSDAGRGRASGLSDNLSARREITLRQVVGQRRVWIGLLLGVAGLVVALWGVDLGEAVSALSGASLPWLGLGAAATVGTLACRAMRWRMMFHPQPLPFRSAFEIIAVADLGNAILPLRLGDVVRIQLAGERAGRSKARTTATLAAELVLDVVIVTLLLALLLPFLQAPGWLTPVLSVTAVVVGALLVVLATVWFRREQTLDSFDRLLRRLPERWSERLRGVTEQVIDGLSALESPRAALEVVAWTAARWLVGAVVMWSALAALDLPRSATSALFLVGVAAISLTVPAAPGEVGVYHASIVEAMALVLGASRSEAASYAVVAHLLTVVPPIVLGVVVVWRAPDIGRDLFRWGGRQERDRRDTERREQVPAQG